MKSRLLVTLLAATLMGTAAQAGLQIQKHRKSKGHQVGQKVKVELESYPAMEEGGVASEVTPSEITVARTEATSPAASASLESVARTRALEERVSLLEKRLLERTALEAPGLTKAPVSAAATDASFEKVPPTKVDMIASRLKLVDSILRESGRAYDYRVMTTSQLRGILDAIRSARSTQPTSADSISLAE